jgi:hypothetical protein
MVGGVVAIGFWPGAEFPRWPFQRGAGSAGAGGMSSHASVAGLLSGELSISIVSR